MFRLKLKPLFAAVLIALAATSNVSAQDDLMNKVKANQSANSKAHFTFTDVIKGMRVYEEERDQAMVSAAPPRQAERVLENYPEDQFKRNLPSWRKLILAGKANADFIRDKVSSLHTMSDAQMDQLYAADREYAEAEAAKAAEAPQEDAAQ